MTVRNQMGFRLFILLTLVLVGSTSCSYEATIKTENAVEQSIEKFHDQLNQQKYQDIYAESDPELRSRITEVELTAQLLNAHEQMGEVTGKAYVIIDDGVGRALRRALSGGRETVKYVNFKNGKEIVGDERFSWAVENDLPRLVSYEWTKICKRPCTVGFGQTVLSFP